MKQCSLLAKKNSSKFSSTVMKKSFILFPARPFFLLLFFSYTDLHMKERFAGAISAKQSSLLPHPSTPSQTQLTFLHLGIFNPQKSTAAALGQQAGWAHTANLGAHLAHSAGLHPRARPLGGPSGVPSNSKHAVKQWLQSWHSPPCYRQPNHGHRCSPRGRSGLSPCTPNTFHFLPKSYLNGLCPGDESLLQALQEALESQQTGSVNQAKCKNGQREDSDAKNKVTGPHINPG